jgi:hypothetical protein
VLHDQRSHARLISDVTDDERGALRDRPIETGREVVEHNDALAGIDERMNHVASDIAGAAGDQERHARGPLLSPGVAGSDVGNVMLRACISGVDCEAREGTRIIRVRCSQAHLFGYGSDAPMLGSGAFQSVSKTSLIPGSS